MFAGAIAIQLELWYNEHTFNKKRGMTMPRYVNDLQLLYEPNSTFRAIHDYLIREGFEYINFEGEQVFKKGKGWIAAPTLIKVTFGPQTVRVESWMKYAILPGVYAGELGWDGFVGCLAKGTMKRCTRQVEAMLGNQPAQPSVAYGYMPMQPHAQPAAPVQSVAPVQYAAAGVCPGCGSPITPDVRFCATCGRQIG